MDAVGGGGPSPRVRHRLVVPPLLQHELPLRGVLDLAGVAAGQYADSVVLVVQILAALVVERFHQTGGVKVVLEAPGGGLDGSGSVAKYLGDPQAPLVVGRLRRLDKELNFSFPILQGFNVEMLLAVHLFFLSEYLTWFGSSGMWQAI